MKKGKQKMSGLRAKVLTLVIAFIMAFSFFPLSLSNVYAADTYPAKYKNAARDAVVDEWNFYNRECTSFVAWCLNNRNGVAFTNYYGGVRWGNAGNWGNAARSIGISVDNNPAVGSVAWWSSGHVGWVSAVNGNSVTTEEYNWNYDGKYHTRTQDKSKITGFIHIKDMTSGSKKEETVKGSEMSSGAGKWLPSGDYEIVSAVDRSYCLDIAGDAVPASTGTNVNLWERSSTPRVQDVFTVTYLNNGFYRIRQKGTNMCLDVNDASVNQGANVQMWGRNSTYAQQWSISPMATEGTTNAFRIEAKCSGFSLDISDASLKNGTNVQQYSDNNSAAQAWIFVPYKPSQPIRSGKYILVSALNTNLELDVAGDTGNIETGTNVQIWKDSCPSKYNSFYVTKLSNGYYRLTHVASGKCLDSYGGVTTEGANIEVWDKNNTDAQQWAITRSRYGYVLRARCSGMAMDVAGGATDNGTNVRQWTYNGSKAQAWHFVQAEYSVRFQANGGSGGPARQIKYYKEALTLSRSIPSRSGYTFLGWSANRNSATATYRPGSSYRRDANVTLYAVWRKNS